MKRPLTAAILALGAFGTFAPTAYSEVPKATITIEADKPLGTVSPSLYGLMTEEINHCYDGGLYAELVQNRAFLDDAKQAVHWSALGGTTIALDPKQPLNKAIPTSLRVEFPAGGGGVANDGYWGFPVTPATTYRLRFFAKAAPGFAGPLTAALESADGATVYAKAETPALGAEWKQYDLTLTTDKSVKPTTLARLALNARQPGTVWLGFVSLFPPTWNDRPNGLRRDLMQMLVDLKPAFLRFPGGNYLEGVHIDTRFKWWETLGPVTERPGHPGTWSYRSSDGMGLMEFLLWCEDMKAEPVLGLYAGYSLSGEYVKPGSDLQPYIQEALDEIEYVTGPVTSKWGAQRAKDGHPEPFPLHYVEIGNEDFFDRTGSYDGRFAQFSDAIKKAYPGLECIASEGVSDHPVKGLVSSRKPDVIDIHFYRSTEEFLKKITEFDTRFGRKGPKAFIGEWAAHEDPKIKPWSKEARSQPPTPSMKAALGDAAVMAAMERNSDIIVMHCYAPLFANVNPGAWQWRPNLIGYDALQSYGSPSYYAFRMFSRNHGDEILKTVTTDTPLQVSATRDRKSSEIILKLVNPQDAAQAAKIELKGIASVASSATAITLAARPEETNSLEQPRNVIPKETTVDNIGTSFDYTVPANGIVVLKLKQG